MKSIMYLHYDNIPHYQTILPIPNPIICEICSHIFTSARLLHERLGVRPAGVSFPLVEMTCP